ncbi:ORF6N domain-containing protein [Numidum massiliense]|uniref:ORF6N domain-containing protein n=1 Tax=Numidum massiliense TaxID=1522315 RepID=UPI0006D5AEE3|nr:ORF6N domain-containing protein [Numidum massiliense]
MNKLTPIDHQDQRVLTTAQLAEAYGTDSKNVNDNFYSNKKRYAQGKHYFELRGEELKAFKASTEISGNLKFAPVLYLWTEKGAWMHAKSLNTDQAWDAYEMLVDDYYRVKQPSLDTSALSPELQMFNQIFNAVARIELGHTEMQKKLAGVEKRQEQITEVLSLNPTEWRKKTNSLLSKIAQARGGFDAYREVRKESYQKLEERARCDLSRRLTNKRRKMLEEGVAKSRVDKTNRMDVIADDARLTEVYLAIVKEMAIQYRVESEVTV